MFGLKKITQKGEKSVFVNENSGEVHIYSPKGEVVILNPKTEEGIEQLKTEIGSGFEEILSLLQAILAGINTTQIPHALTKSPFDPPIFIGRDEELDDLHQRLFDGENFLLLVNGKGGMGKTSLASRYYKNYQDEYEHVGWVLSEKSIADALLLLSTALGLNFAGSQLPIEERLDLLLAKLANLTKPCLLVIDNVNEPEDLTKNFAALRSCTKFHLLLTTRITKFQGANFFPVKGLKKEFAVDLFKKHYKAHRESEDELLVEIIKAVENNTLIIELFAKNLAEINDLEPEYSLQNLFDDIQQNLTSLSQSEIISTGYQSKDPKSLRTAKPEEIVLAMYDVRALSEEEKKLISVFAVLPNEEISYRFLKSLIPGFEIKKSVSSLCQKGWIDKSTDPKTSETSLKVNQVVQDVVKIKHSDRLLKDCKSMIDFLSSKFSSQDFNAALPFLDISDSILKNIGETRAETFMFSVNVSQKFRKTGELLKAKEIIEKVYKDLNQNEPLAELLTLFHNIPIVETCAGLLGEIYNELGDLLGSLKVFNELADSVAKKLESDSNNSNLKNGLAISYSKLGETHSSLGNLEKALTFFEERSRLGKELYEAYPQNVSFKNGLAISYSKLGETQSSLGNLEKALTFFEDETVLFEELYEAYPQNVSFKNGLAISYSKLGETQSSLGNLEKALTFFEDETVLFEELYEAYPQNVSFKNGLAISYSKLGETQSSLGNLEKALTFFEERSRLGKELYEAYPQNVSFKNGLAISYSKLGSTHSSLGNLEKALTFYEKDLQLTKELYEAYPQNVSFKNGLAISYEKLGSTHSSLGNLEKALTFFEDETVLFEELYEAYPQNVSFKNGLAISYSKLGSTHSSLGNLEKALTFFEDETVLFEELYEAYPQNVSFKNGLAISYSKLGETHSSLGNLEKALTFYEKDLQLTKELYEAYPQNVSFKNGLAISYEKLGETHSSLGNLEKALTFFEERSRLGKELYEAYPQNVSFKNGLAVSYSQLGRFYRDHKNDRKTARSFFEKCFKLWKELSDNYPNYVQFTNNFQWAENVIKELK